MVPCTNVFLLTYLLTCLLLTCYFASYTGWRLQNRSSISSPFWFTSASTEWRRRIWQMSFSSRRTLLPGHGFVRHRHCSFAVHGCRLSATERFRSLLPVFGTVSRVMSPPLHRCLSTVAAWRVKAVLPMTSTYVVRAQWLCHFRHFNRSCLFVCLLTYCQPRVVKPGRWPEHISCWRIEDHFRRSSRTDSEDIAASHLWAHRRIRHLSKSSRMASTSALQSRSTPYRTWNRHRSDISNK